VCPLWPDSKPGPLALGCAALHLRSFYVVHNTQEVKKEGLVMDLTFSVRYAQHLRRLVVLFQSAFPATPILFPDS
jgi:hypothetical protein